jgi:hypothetical protein
MINLTYQIITKVKEFIPRVYNRKAPSDATFPYAIISKRGYGDNTNESDFIYYIELIDNSTDTTEIETLESQIMKSVGLDGLDHFCYEDDDLTFEMFYDDNYSDETEDNNEYLNSRVLEFYVRAYFYS